MTTDLQTVGAMHQCKTGEPYSTCVYCGATAEKLNAPCPSYMQQVAQLTESLTTPTAQAAPALHPKTADLVQRFSAALAEKLAAAEKKYGYSDGWASPDWLDECRQKLLEHVTKGDPRDVAAYCAFLWHHGASTAAPAATPQADSQPALTPETASAMVEGMDMNDRVLAAIDAEIKADSVLEDAALLDWLALAGPTSICVVIDREYDGEVEVSTDDVTGYGKTLREALNAARKQGAKP